MFKLILFLSAAWLHGATGDAGDLVYETETPHVFASLGECEEAGRASLSPGEIVDFECRQAA